MLLDPELHYLDNAATTMVDPEIAGAIHEALLKDWANPSSLYEPAVETHEALTTARGQIARTLGCQAKDLYFTSCGSESNNLAVQGLAMARKNWGSKIVVSGFEHPSVQRPIRALKDRGFEVVEILPEADGHLDVAKLAAEVDKNTVLVSCMAVNNETGTLQDIAALSTAVKAKNSRCAVHVDAVQAWLRIPIDLKSGRTWILSRYPAIKCMPPRESALCSSGTACARRFARPTWAATRSAACAPAPRIPLISLALALLRQREPKPERPQCAYPRPERPAAHRAGRAGPAGTHHPELPGGCRAGGAELFHQLCQQPDLY